jgi:2-polyprenyl-3-methyl-5-hydroxy-6-metoxy-1,4-benzoquinol methylase
MTNQDKIWQYYQTHSESVFSQAKARLNWICKRVEKIARGIPKASVLTIGIGDGYLERKLYEQHFDITCLDPDAQSINKLSQAGVKGFVGTMENVNIIFANRTFNVVVASEVIEHLSLENINAALSALRQILDKDAIFLGTVPYNESLAQNQVVCPKCGELFHRWGHQTSFDKLKLESILGKYFESVHTEVRAFASFDRRSIKRNIKSAAKLMLGRMGSPIVFPNIYFEASSPNK